jgi:hypothetical protein
MRTIIVILLLIISTQTHAERKVEWARVFNEAESVTDLERASVLMEQDDYIRHSEDLKAHLDKDHGTNPPTDLEREYVYWKIAHSYLFFYERYHEKENLIKMNIYMRKLLEIPNRHLFSEYLIARIQEHNGESYSSKVKVPRGTTFWEFDRFKDTHGFFLDDVSKEYKEIADKKRMGFFKTVCWVLMICVGGAKFDNEVILKDLHKPFYVTIHTKEGYYKPEEVK